MKPYKCPVCSGSGLVPNGFYGALCPSDVSTLPVTCRSCTGGVVWDKELPTLELFKTFDPTPLLQIMLL